MKESAPFRFHSRWLHSHKTSDEIASFERVSLHFQKARAKAAQEIPEWEEHREQAKEIRSRSLKEWKYWWDVWKKNAEKRGIEVLWAEDAEEACRIAQTLLPPPGAKILKSKSMVSEEIELNDYLQAKGYSVVETDLGEFLIQQAGHRPCHLIAPAVHLTRTQVAKVLSEKTQMPYTEEIPDMTRWVRQLLREDFLHASVGITGVNFAIAETGQVAIVENEGNARMVTTLPPLHLMFLTPEKIIPRWDDLWLFLTLLIRSATGQRLSSYISILPGKESDGIRRVAIVVDNGRTELLKDELGRQILRCIRCGACLNACPVYRTVGGHTYPWVLAGPIGAILAPALHAQKIYGDTGFASTLCGACEEVCPVKIPFTHFFHKIRTGQRHKGIAFLYRLYCWFYSSRRTYSLFHTLMRMVPWKFLDTYQVVLPIPLFRHWAEGRASLTPAPKSFYRLWEEKEKWQKIRRIA